MKSVRRKGFLYETGPNSALETTPLFKELVADLGLESEMVYADPVGKNRFILRDGRLMALPMGPGAFIRTPLFSWKAKFRLMAEPFIGRAEKEESIAEFVTRRIGSEFLDYATTLKLIELGKMFPGKGLAPCLGHNVPTGPGDSQP